MRKKHSVKVFDLLGYDYSKSTIPIEQPKALEATAKVSFNPEHFMLKGNQTLALDLQFEAPQLNTTISDHIIYGGYLQVHAISIGNSSDTETLQVPYIGSLGRQRDLKLLDTKVSKILE